MKITLEIPNDDIRAALDTARSAGGIGYWADFFDVLNCRVRVRLEMDDPHGGRWHRLDIARGLRMMYTGHGPHDCSATAGKGYQPAVWDAHESDCFVQYAAFGKLVYS